MTLHVRETPGPADGRDRGLRPRPRGLVEQLDRARRRPLEPLPRVRRRPARLRAHAPAVDGRLPARGARRHRRRLPRGPSPAGVRARAPARQLARRRGVAAGRRRATRPGAHADPRQPGHARPAPAAVAPRREARGAGAAAAARGTRPGRAGVAHAPRPARATPWRSATPTRRRSARTPSPWPPRRPRSARSSRGRPRRCTARSWGWWAPGSRRGRARSGPPPPRSPRRRWWCGVSSTVSSAWDAPPAPPRRCRPGALLRLSGVGHVAQIERPEIVARAVLGLFDGAADGSWPAAGLRPPGPTPDR